MATLPEGKKKKKKIKRKQGVSKLYFTNETQSAIVSFQKALTVEEKQKIYEEQIHPAFDKLVENLIFIHGFLGLYDSYEDLKSDCITFLYQALPKFDDSKGFLAFSYFNIIAKHFLIIKSKQRGNKIKRNVSIDDPDSMGDAEIETLKEYCTVPSPDDQMIEKEFGGDISELLTEIRARVKNEVEDKCIESIIFIFNNIDTLDFFNKRAVLVYLREMSGLSAKQLTTTMSAIKKHYKELRNSDDFGIF